MGNICGVSNNSVNSGDNPGDLIVDILSKLPVRSLIRFKSVCKAWMLLINSQVFINKHSKNPRFRGYSLRGRKKGGEYSFIEKVHSICPVEIEYTAGTCNGIVCLEARSSGRRLVLFNPSTREFSYVPPQLCVDNQPPRSLMSASCGFCYLPKTQEYRIVFFHELYQYRNLIDITTVTLGKIPSSRVAKNVSLPGREIGWRHAISGTNIFWLALEFGSNHQFVIFYDVVEEKFGRMNAPPRPSPPPPSNSVRRSLGLLKGSVIMFDNFLYNSTFFDIWMMLIDDDVSNGKSWMKYRRVGPLCDMFGIPKHFVYPLEVCWDGRWILCCKADRRLLSKYQTRHIFFYDLDTNQVEDYSKILKDREEDYKATKEPILEFVNYQESLVSIDSLLPYIDQDPPEDIH